MNGVASAHPPADGQPDDDPRTTPPERPAGTGPDLPAGTWMLAAQAPRPRPDAAPRALQVAGTPVESNERIFADERARILHWERVRALGAELLLRRLPVQGADVIAVVSPCRGEGRSVLAADLALAVAQTGLRTLLVDGDLRRPTQHHRFGAGRLHGFADALVTLTQPLLYSVRGANDLFLLTAGQDTADPLRVLSNRHLQTLVGQWRSAFQAVVIDTPPSFQHPDALLLANLATRSLVVSRAAQTPQPALADLLRRLAGIGAPVTGAVLNHF